MSRILITGAAGFIGTHLVRALRARHEVLGLVRTAPTGEAAEGVRWIVHDLTQPLDCSRLPENIDAVIHLAQSRFYKQFPDRADDIFEVNTHSTFRLLEYARQADAGSFIFASSGGIYGCRYEKFVETDPVSPLGFYFTSKYSAELLVANYRQYFRTVVLRPFFVYGPGQKGMLMPTLLGRVARGETVVVEGDPGLRVNPLHVADAVRVFEPALSLGTSGLFNIAGDESVTITDLVALMGEILGKKPSVVHTEADPDGDLIGDNTRMKEVLGVRPETSLREGLRQMATAQAAR